MAWTDTCKTEAVRAIDAKMDTGKKTKRAALKEVSVESDIPVGTLTRWKYSKKNGFKNEPKQLTEDQIWLSIAKRMEKLSNDISAKGELPPKVSPKTIETVKKAFKGLDDYFHHFEGNQ